MKIPDLKKIFSHKTKNSNHSFVIMRPNHDWKIVVYIFIFLSIIFIAFSFYFLTRVRNDTLFKVERTSNKNTSLLNQELLDKTLSEFATKADKIKNFPTDPKFINDPSR
ncbi:hypothetical protein IT400_03950 [Candidatus Nomurabacteria bacterium]|nr:hypothetical protein [Candidatus Nomurabacteria bacterium]